MLSEEVFEILGDYKFPILIQNEEVDNIDDLETIYEVDIFYKYAFKNPKYSELSNTMPLFAENLNAFCSMKMETFYSHNLRRILLPLVFLFLVKPAFPQRISELPTGYLHGHRRPYTNSSKRSY